MVVEAGQLLLSDHILGPDKPDSLERYFFGQLRLRPLLAGLYVGNSAGEFFYVMRSNEKVEGGTRTKVIRNGPRGREVELTWRRPDYAIVKSEQDPRILMIRERATGIAPRLNGAVAYGPSPTSSSPHANPGSRSPLPLSGKTVRLKLCSELISR